MNFNLSFYNFANWFFLWNKYLKGLFVSKVHPKIDFILKKESVLFIKWSVQNKKVTEKSAHKNDTRLLSTMNLFFKTHICIWNFFQIHFSLMGNQASLFILANSNDIFCLYIPSIFWYLKVPIHEKTFLLVQVAERKAIHFFKRTD